MTDNIIMFPEPKQRLRILEVRISAQYGGSIVGSSRLIRLREDLLDDLIEMAVKLELRK